MPDPSAEALRDLIRRIDPDGEVSWAVAEIGTEDILPEETAAMARALPHRRAEFAAGRRAARAAMVRLGLPAAPIPMGADRAPLWPEGVIGSISHAGRLALAGVARAGAHRGIGVDLDADVPLDPALIPVICRPEELSGLPPGARAGQAARLFSAKEAAYKAHYPVVGRVFGFHGLSVDLARGRARFTDDPEVAAFPPESRADLTLRQVHGGGLVLSLGLWPWPSCFL